VNKLISSTVLIGLLAAPMAFASLAGCGAGNEEQAQVRPNPPPTPPPPPNPAPNPTPGPTTGDPPPDQKVPN
jgi:hypothetical protein